MSKQNAISVNDLPDQEYVLPGEITSAPTGFDPDAAGTVEQPSVGWHRARIVDMEIVDQYEWTWKGESGVGVQIQPIFEVVGGPEAGNRIRTFLPMPGDQQHLPIGRINQWGHFIKRLGFALPPGRIMPESFKLRQMIGRECMINVVHPNDAEGNPKMFKGRPQHDIDLFGFDWVPETIPGDKRPVAKPKYATDGTVTTHGLAEKAKAPAASTSAALKPASKVKL